MSITELSRTVAFRLTLFYSLFFTLCVVMLLGFIYWQTAAEMTRRVDQVLLLEKGRLAAMPPDSVSDEIDRSIRRDRRQVYFYALFTSEGRLIAGNVPHLPQDMPVDGKVHEITLPPSGAQSQPFPARLLALRSGPGNVLLVGHDVRQLIEFGEIMTRAFYWGGSLTILLGLMFGLALSFRPLRRVKQIQQAAELVMGGNIKERLPLAGRRDELDMLAATVNRMLDEIERLMSEIKSAGDNIAHDLRTPLTRLRAVLYRLQQQMGEASGRRGMVDQAIADVDSLLLRFRALLRISEIESKQRLAGFKTIRLQDILAQAVTFIEPLAEEKAVSLSMTAIEFDPIDGDSELLFEALVNLLDNAVKFTPPGGSVRACLSQGAKGAQIEIRDSGIGISESERSSVINRFYRGGNGPQASGYGLGLSIVMAIVRVHDFGFELSDANPGTCATVYCWRQHTV